MKLLKILFLTAFAAVGSSVCVYAGKEQILPVQNAAQPQEPESGNEKAEQPKWLEGTVMEGALAFNRILEKGMSGNDVSNFQQRLFDLGYLVFSPDGIYDSRTEAALKQFQEDHGLYADGRVGVRTMAALNWRHFLDEPVTSEFADDVILTEKCYSREGDPIRFIIPHHMAARNTGVDCAEYFTYNTVGTSANYCIGYEGDIVQNVPEQYGAWTSGDVNFDRKAITIEVSDTAVNDYRIPLAAQDALVDLCVDIVKRNPSLGGRLVYDPEDEARVIAIKQGAGSWDSIRGNVLIHCWTTTAGTTCPEWHMKEILPGLIDRVNSRLQGPEQGPEQEPKQKPGPEQEPKPEQGPEHELKPEQGPEQEPKPKQGLEHELKPKQKQKPE